MVQFDLLPSPSSLQPLGQVQPFGPEYFSLIFRSMCYFFCSLHETTELKTTYFQGKMQEFVGITIKIKVCIWRNVLKFQRNVRRMQTQIDLFFVKENNGDAHKNAQ